MSRTSFIMGLALAFIAHVIFLLAGNHKQATSSKGIKPEAKNVAKLIMPSPMVKEQKKQEFAEKPHAPKIERLQEVVKAAGVEFANETGDFFSTESTDLLPTLRLIWNSPEQLLEVARSLGMRILVVNRGNQPIGELIFERDILIKPFNGGLTNFSNRVRTISSTFFGPEVLNQSDEAVHCFWVLIPASVDRQWVSVQKEAIKSKGLNSSQVSYMEARIVSDEKSYRLVVTRIITV